MEKVYVPRDPHEKAMQRALIQYRDPANYDLVKEALLKAGRADLIGFGTKCLIPPRKMGDWGGHGKKHGTGDKNGRGTGDVRREKQERHSKRKHSQAGKDRPGKRR